MIDAPLSSLSPPSPKASLMASSPRLYAVPMQGGVESHRFFPRWQFTVYQMKKVRVNRICGAEEVHPVLPAHFLTWARGGGTVSGSGRWTCEFALFPRLGPRSSLCAGCMVRSCRRCFSAPPGPSECFCPWPALRWTAVLPAGEHRVPLVPARGGNPLCGSALGNRH